ncbi:MAG: helix-turn-helix domain-containing protein [Pseudomonadota bacterium]
MPKITSERYDSSVLPPDQRLEDFQQFIAPFYEIWPIGSADQFGIFATGHRIDDLLFNQVEFSPARFRRGAEHLQGDGQDFLVLEAMIDGEQTVVMKHGHVHMRRGYVYLRDWSHEYEAYTSAMRINSIVIPRHRLSISADAVASTPVLSFSLEEPDGRMLALLWQHLLAEFDVISSDQARPLCAAFLASLSSLLGDTGGKTPSVSLGAMQQYLNVRLQGELSVDGLCERFQVSRSTVYRLFEPLGGIRTFITRARLERSYAELLASNPARVTVAGVAASWGFPEASTFSRRFRAHFGLPPSEVLGRAYVEPSAPPNEEISSDADPSRTYRRWLAEVSGRLSQHPT